MRFEHETHGIAHELDWFVPAEDPVRICRLKLTNTGDRARRLSVTQFVEWVLGDSRQRAQQLVVTWFDAENDMLTAHNHFNLDFPGRCAFLACDRPLHSWTASRTEFVGRNRTPSNPAAMGRKGLGEISGRYHDNCGALMSAIELAPGESAEVSFLLGQTATLEEARELVARHREPRHRATTSSPAAPTSGATCSARCSVKTPDEQLDLMVNGQALYQALACRLWGRTATYQSSGAYGFRDQLQDCLALLIARPDLVREQIVEASRHQFPEGDVLHWWQPFSGRGVRTHISDDRHWLPLVVAEYLSATGDTSVLDEVTAFIEGPLLPIEDEDVYLQPAISEQAATVYEHCIRALESGRPRRRARAAAHGRRRLERRHEPRRSRGQGRERLARLVPHLRAASASRRSASRAATSSGPTTTATGPSGSPRRSRRRRGTAPGTAARTSTTARRWAPTPPRSAASTPSPSRGRRSRAPATR